MDPIPNDPVADLGWSHVGFGLTFIAFNAVISQALQLRLGASLVVAALRCVVQLTLVATVLQRVFAAKSIWAVTGIACKYAVVASLAGGSLTFMLDPPSLAEHTRHVRSRCVRYLITAHFSLADSRGLLAKQVVIKAQRRYKDMVRMSCSLFIVLLPRIF
jgi:ABC-type iron transport system FetAB permease component